MSTETLDETSADDPLEISFTPSLLSLAISPKEPATAGTSFSAAVARSALLLLGAYIPSKLFQVYPRLKSTIHHVGIYFKRPSRLFRPTRGTPSLVNSPLLFFTC